MSLSRRHKRILTFSIIPFLAAVPFITDDLSLQAISVAVLVIYVGFIIFLRDSVQRDVEIPESNVLTPDIAPITQALERERSITIAPAPKKIEFISDEDLPAEIKTVKKKEVFLPPDLKETFERIANEPIPKDVGQDKQFGFVLKRLLTVVRESNSAHTAVFFWYNKKKEKLTVESYDSDSSEIETKKYDLEDDILSKIIQKEEPELLTDVPAAAEKDVIRYYNMPQGIKSFVGVPLFYGNSLAGILALDSKSSDAFGIETIYSLGKFVRVITIIIALFEEKYSESLAEKRLNGILSFLSQDEGFSNEMELFQTLENSVRELIPWDAFTFVYFQPGDQKFRTAKVLNKTTLKYIGENLDVELNGTLVGRTILSGIPVKIDDVSQRSYRRYSPSEDITFDGSFLAVPLVYNNQNYGVFCFESMKKNLYSNSDVQFLKNAVKMLAYVVYSFSAQAMLKSLIAIDVDTKALNYETFKKNLQTELLKANQAGLSGALALIHIDEFLEQESLFDGNPFPKVLQTVNEIIQAEVSPTSLIGRSSERVFAVYFFNIPAKEAFIWAEKLRVKIARKPIAVVSKQTTFTISVGVASTMNYQTAEEALHNAELALKKALEKGGNTVRNIN
ncbi:MAG TPA: GAF domain-containing protein [Ignavibacteriales bacterium]|nr:GAF domain-containing protein [Ignavibacteriales bacterium]